MRIQRAIGPSISASGKIKSDFAVTPGRQDPPKLISKIYPLGFGAVILDGLLSIVLVTIVRYDDDLRRTAKNVEHLLADAIFSAVMGCDQHVSSFYARPECLIVHQ